MPGKDKINPKANEWMEREGLSVPKAITAKPKQEPKRKTSAQVQRLERRLGRKPDELAEEIPADTIRRTKYPVLEQRNPDGTRTFEHDLGIKADGRLHT